MTVTNYKTNLNCQSCVAKVKPLLDGDERIEHWSVDTSSPDKTLSVAGERVSPHIVKQLVEKAGFRVLSEVKQDAASENPPRPTTKLVTYYPLLLVVSFIAGVVTIVDLRDGVFDWENVMNWFMGGFFLVFAFFKLLNVPAFVMSFQTYDVLARRVPAYGYAYPFIELLLGMAYLTGAFPLATNLVTMGVMGLGLVGVTKALLAKRKIQCACLGTVFNLPMSSVTFIENTVMVGMAMAMIASHSSP